MAETSPVATQQIDGTHLFLQSCIDRLTDAVHQRGMNISIEHDFSELKNHLASQSAVINPSFDPDEHELDDAFWLRISDPGNRTIACHAERIYRSPDFIADYLETGRLWWHRKNPRPIAEWRSEISPLPIQLSGVVAYAGSMLIAKPHRGQGLSLILPYLSRALCLRNYQSDFHTGLVRQSLASSTVPIHNYGFPRTSPIFRGLLPGVEGEFEQIHLCWLTRDEGIRRLAELPRHPKFPIPLGSRSTAPSSAALH